MYINYSQLTIEINMAVFDVKEFKTALQQSIKDHKRELNLTLEAALLLPCDDVKDLFTKNGYDTQKINIGLKHELKQLDERRSRLEKEDDDEKDASDSFERRRERAAYDKWEKKSEDEALYSLISSVELRAKIEGREPTGSDVLKEMALRNQRSELEEGAGVETFRILNIDFFKLFPDLEERRTKNRHKSNAEGAERISAIADAVAITISDRFPGLQKLLGPDGQGSGFAGKFGGTQRSGGN
jgi:hypothetical protein